MTTHEPAVSHQGDGGLLRVRMQLSYDGAPFSGWARQPGLLTVQGVLEEALATLTRRHIRVTVAGRTDAGVHARGQVVHFDLTPGEWEGLSRGKDILPGDSLRRRLRGVMNKLLNQAFTDGSVRSDSKRAASSVGAIEIHSAELAAEGFDARFSALWRRYNYRIADDAGNWDPLTRHLTLWQREPVNVDRMNEAAKQLLGLNDFLAYCKPRQGATTIRELQRFEFSRGSEGVITATIQADAFCHNMVRCLVGAALIVGTGDRSTHWMLDRMNDGTRATLKMAPAHPLVLEEVGYPDAASLRARAQETRARRGSE
ncbi:tRNA pseudouridine(38-40) synthase TruA [Arthrobacter pigmenti]